MKATSFVFCALAAAPLSSQEPVTSSAPRPPLGIEEVAGRPHLTATPEGALGRAGGYRVHFGPGGWDLAVAGGGAGADPCTVRYALDQVGRRASGGTFEGTAVADAAPSVEGDTVRYVRGAFVERYELRREGVAQSFVFETLPKGEGDLVVRGRLVTGLLPAASAKDVPDLRFARADGMGIAFGRVSGVDARGARAEGWMRCENGWLDLVLPGAFVDRAALPLVLDPIIGPTIPLPGADPWYAVIPYWGRRVFDVAYDANTGLFLYVWDHSYAEETGLTWGCVSGQRVSAHGAFVGTPIVIAAIPMGQIWNVTVAPAGSRAGFVVSMHASGEYGWSDSTVSYIDAATGVRVWPGSVTLQSYVYDVGVFASGNAAMALHISRTGTTESMGATLLSIDAAGHMSVAGSRTLATGDESTFGNASISTTASLGDRQLLVWDETHGTEQNLFGAIVDAELNVLDSGAVGLSSTNKRSPAVDGDGTKWCVAYQSVSSGSILCFGVFWDPNSDSAYVTQDVPVAAAGSSPVVASTGESYLIAYCGGARSVDPFTCRPCGGALSLPFPDRLHRIGSQKSSSTAAGDLGMIVSGVQLETEQFLANGTLFRANDGVITDLGGGCGRGGRAAATCAIVGNHGFTLRVRGALPFAPAALVLGAAPLGLPCGPCTLVPDPARGLALGAGSTDRWGDAAVPAPLPAVPSLVGASFLEQWLVAGGAGSCLGVGDLSNALRVEIQ